MKKQALVFWFTGLSGAGKTTVASRVSEALTRRGILVFVLDGDVFRASQSRHLGFSESDIKQNNALIAEHCARLRSEYDVILVPIISPYAVSRQKAREVLGQGFYEIYLEASLDCLVARDPKGLYRKARNQEITTLIGYSATNPYEAPASADLVIPTDRVTPETSAALLERFVGERLADAHLA